MSHTLQKTPHLFFFSLSFSICLSLSMSALLSVDVDEQTTVISNVWHTESELLDRESCEASEKIGEIGAILGHPGPLVSVCGHCGTLLMFQAKAASLITMVYARTEQRGTQEFQALVYPAARYQKLSPFFKKKREKQRERERDCSFFFF